MTAVAEHRFALALWAMLVVLPLSRAMAPLELYAGEAVVVGDHFEVETTRALAVTSQPPKFKVGDQVTVHGSIAIVRSGPDPDGLYKVMFVDEGIASGPLPANRLAPLAGRLRAGDDVRWRGQKGVVMTSGVDGKYVVQFEDADPAVRFLPGLELHTSAHLDKGDEVVVYGDMAIIRSGPSHDGLYNVVYVNKGLSSYPVPEFAMHVRKPEFNIGEQVSVGGDVPGFVAFGPDADWNYVVRFQNGSASGLLPEWRLHMASSRLIEGDEVEVDGKPGIVIAGPYAAGMYTVNLESGGKVGPVPASRLHRLKDVDVASSNPWRKASPQDLIAARAIVEEEDDDGGGGGSLASAGVLLDVALRISAQVAAERAAEQTMRLSGSPVAVGVATREALAEAGLRGEEATRLACEIAARAVVKNAPPGSQPKEIAALANAAALAAGLSSNGFSAHLAAVAAAVANAEGSTASEVAAATLAAAAVMGMPAGEELHGVARAVAKAAAEAALRRQASPSDIGAGTLVATEAVGVRHFEAVQQASRAAVRVVVSALLRNQTVAGSVASAGLAAATAAGLARNEAKHLVEHAAVHTIVAGPDAPALEALGAAAIAVMQALGTPTADMVLEACSMVAWTSARLVARRGASPADVVAAAEAAVAAVRPPGLEVGNMVAVASARAVASQSVATGMPPLQVGSRARAAAVAAGQSTDQASGTSTLAAVHAVVARLVQHDASMEDVVAAAKSAAFGAGMQEAQIDRTVASAVAQKLVGDLLIQGGRADQAGRTAKSAVFSAGVIGDEGAMLSCEVAATLVFKSSVENGDQPAEIASEMKSVAEVAGLPADRASHIVAAIAAREASKRAAAIGEPAAEVGRAAARFAKASGVVEHDVVFEASSAASAAVAEQVARNGAAPSGVASAALEAAESAGMPKEQAVHVAAAAAAGAVAWKAACDGVLPSEIGQRALEAAEALGISAAEATEVAGDAAAPASISHIEAPEARATAALSAVAATGSPSSDLQQRATRALARDLADRAAAAGWPPDEVANIAMRGILAAGLMSPRMVAVIGSAAASAVVRQAARGGFSIDDAVAAAQAAAGAVAARAQLPELHPEPVTSLDATNRAVTSAVETGLAQHKSPIQIGVSSERAAAAIGSPTAAFIADAVAQAMANHDASPSEVAFAASAAAQAAGASGEETARLSAQLSAQAVADRFAARGATPTEVGIAAKAAVDATGLSRHEVDAAGLPSSKASAAAAQAAALAVVRQMWKHDHGSPALEDIAQAGAAAARAGGADSENAAQLAARFMAEVAAEQARRDGKSEGEILRASETAALSAGLPLDEAIADGGIALATAEGSDMQPGSDELEQLVDPVRSSAEQAMMMARPGWEEAITVPAVAPLGDSDGLGPIVISVPAFIAASVSSTTTSRSSRSTSTSSTSTSSSTRIRTTSTLPPHEIPAFPIGHRSEEDGKVGTTTRSTPPPGGVRQGEGHLAAELGDEAWLRKHGSSQTKPEEASFAAILIMVLSVLILMPALGMWILFLAKVRTTTTSGARVMTRFCTAQQQGCGGGVYSALDLEGGLLAEAFAWYPKRRFAGRRVVVVLEWAALECATGLSQRAGDLLAEEESSLAEFSITYHALWALFRTPLHRAGHLLVYMHSVGGMLVEVNPAFPVPGSAQRFARVVAELIRRGHVGGDDGEGDSGPLLSIVTGTLHSLLPDHCRHAAVSVIPAAGGSSGSPATRESGCSLQLDEFISSARAQVGGAVGLEDDGRGVFVFVVSASSHADAARADIGGGHIKECVSVAVGNAGITVGASACRQICDKFTSLWNVADSAMVSPSAADTTRLY